MQLSHSSIGTGVLEGRLLQGCERNLYAGPLSATTSRGISPKVIRVSYCELPQTCCHDHVHDWWGGSRSPFKVTSVSPSQIAALNLYVLLCIAVTYVTITLWPEACQGQCCVSGMPVTCSPSYVFRVCKQPWYLTTATCTITARSHVHNLVFHPCWKY